MTEAKTKTKQVLSEERLQKLAAAREKALEVKRQLRVIKDDEKKTKKEEREKKYKQVLSKHAETAEPEEKEEIKVQGISPLEKAKADSTSKKVRKKVVKKVIEISESESDTEPESQSESESESEDDEPVIVIKKKKKPKKRTPPKPKTQPKEPRTYETDELTSAVAKDMLKQRLLQDTQRIAFNSLFPYHNF